MQWFKSGLVVAAAVIVAACQPGMDAGSFALTAPEDRTAAQAQEPKASEPEAGEATPPSTPDNVVALDSDSAEETRSVQSGEYFVEFRARRGYTYGHTVAVYGRIDAAGDMADVQVAGLTPGPENDPMSLVVGHVLPVSARTGYSDGDLDEDAVIARWRIPLTEEEYVSLAAYIDELRQNSTVWHATFYNCNAFAGDIARHLGLRQPPSWMLPGQFVNAMRLMNSAGDSRQPVKLAASPDMGTAAGN